jgi:hypothetical protein
MLYFHKAERNLTLFTEQDKLITEGGEPNLSFSAPLTCTVETGIYLKKLSHEIGSGHA